MNSIGRVCAEGRFSAGEVEPGLDLTALSPGTYFLEVRNGESVVRRELNKVR
jgi:hypothetical protein